MRTNWQLLQTSNAIGLIVFVIIAASLIGWVLLDQTHSHHSQIRNEVTTSYSDPSAEQSQIICLPTSDPPTLSCVLNNPDSVGDQQAAQYDLKAQQDMAEWSLGMMIAAAATVLITGIGVIYVVRTLDATREMTEQARAANKITRDLVEAEIAQERPYIYIYGIGEVRFSRPGDEKFAAHVPYELANLGRLPAKITGVRAEMSTSKGAPTELPLELDFIDLPDDSLLNKPAIAPSEPRKSIALAPHGISFKQMIGDLPIVSVKPGENFYCWVIISYEGPFTKGFETAMCWKWNVKQRRFVPHLSKKHTYMK